MNYSVIESIWLATAVMAYEAYHNSEVPKVEDMYFRQADIRQRA